MMGHNLVGDWIATSVISHLETPGLHDMVLVAIPTDQKSMPKLYIGGLFLPSQPTRWTGWNILHTRYKVAYGQ